MRWLLDEKGFPIDQREFEYDTELFGDRQSNELGTALHIAAETNSLDCLRFLLERGIDAELPDTLHRTAEDRARKYEHQEAVSILKFRNG
jgi:ankyrin repeat protein